VFGFITITVPAMARVLAIAAASSRSAMYWDFFVERKNHVRAAFALRLSAIEPALARVRHHYDFFAFAPDLAIQFVFDPAKPFSSRSTKPSTCEARSRFG